MICFIIGAVFVLFSLSTVSAATHSLTDSNQTSHVQSIIDTSTDTELVIKLADGNYNFNQINIKRNASIIGNSKNGVKITGTSSGTLFNITASNVKLINLTISEYTTAINSNQSNLSIINCNISTIDRSIHLRGNSLTGILLENNTITSSVNNTSYGAVYATATQGSVVNIALKGNNILGNGTTNSRGVYFLILRCNNTITFDNNNITGTSMQGVYLDAYNNCNNTITITNNNITGTSGNSVALYAFNNSNNTITIINNNIIGTSASGVVLHAYNSTNNITFTNNNITGTSQYGVDIRAYASNNTIIFTNNNITGTPYGLYLWISYSNNTITITNNNITGTSYGLSLYAFNSNNNTITITNNNIRGTGVRGVELRAWTSNNTINFFNNNIKGVSCGLYINCSYNDAFSGLSVVNNTINASDSGGIGVSFLNLDPTALSDILFTGNNIFGGIAGGTGISFDVGLVSVNNVTFNYNRILAATGLNIPTTITGSVDANLNWWGSNSPVIVGMSLDNWFVMSLSADSYWTIVNASTNRTGSVVLTYSFLLYVNSTNTTGAVAFHDLPNFLADIYWNSNGGVIKQVLGVSALGTYSYTVPAGNYALSAVGDLEDVKLTFKKIDTTSTLNAPNNAIVGKPTTINGVAKELANTQLTVTVDGKTYTVTTNSNGEWSLTYTPTKSGKITATVSWAGNTTHNGFTNNTTFNVNKDNKKTKITLERDGNRITATLTDEDGNPLAGKKIVLRDSKGRVLGFGITNKDGQITIIVKERGIKLTATFAGDDNYLGSTASLTLQSEAQTNDNTHTKSNNNPVSAKMQNTGMPIVAILLVLLSMIGVIYRKR